MSIDVGPMNQPEGLAQVLKGMIENQEADRANESAIRLSEQKNNLEEQETTANPLAAALKKQNKPVTKARVKKVEENKESKEATKKNLLSEEKIKDAAQEFGRRYPQLNSDKLKGLADKLKDGMSKEEILKLVHEEYPNSFEAGLALEFLMSVAVDDYKNMIQTVQVDLNQEIIDKREKEVAAKVEAEATQAALEANEVALRLVQGGGDPRKLLEHLMATPTVDAPSLFKLLDDAYGSKEGGKNLKKIELFLMKNCGAQINELKKLEDKEDIAHIKNAMLLLKKLQAILFVDKYFEGRNPRAEQTSSRGLKK
ncbi:MAG: hypothetical protein BGO14_02640 [Chlamydiales bacterium 38-26]|nr:hypothetical protein [Chlamydiales bacterium]OJV09249.1 MAG: hypothetical protein BGO14_02640 [Chlamydiales bacterium 38-26]